MKRTLSLLVLMLLFVLSCEGNKEAATDPEKGATATEGDAPKSDMKVAIVYSTGGKGDKSFNDSAHRGLQRAEAELGVTFVEYEPKDASAESENQLRTFAESQEYELIVAVGFTMKDALAAVATDFPEQKFVLIDDSLDVPNVASITFKENEASFVVGALAALMSKTDTVGFVGAVEAPVINRFRDGYAQGAKYIKPEIKVMNAVVAGASPFSDPGTAKIRTEALISQNADVIFHAAGKSGDGVFEAVKDKDKFAIGVDSNQDDIVPGKVLTSVMKYVDNALFAVVKDTKEGNFKAGHNVFGIKEDGVGITDLKYTKEVIGEENVKKLEEIIEKIRSGEIVVK